MTEEKEERAAAPRQNHNSKHIEQPQQPRPQWFSVPQPVRRVFKWFPLVQYPANLLPQRSPSAQTSQTDNVLFIFQTPQASENAAPSYNPSCLKWQAYLRFHRIPLRTTPSSNHASPTGSLPFLLPASVDLLRPSSPVPSNRIVRWVGQQRGREEVVHPKQELFSALIDHTLRSAWLYYLYLDQSNFDAVAWPMYIESASTHWAVRMSLAAQLQQAARDELHKTQVVIDGNDLYQAASRAFQALSTLLGDDKFFFGQPNPGLFDASLFAYTQLILDERLQWRSPHLKVMLQRYDNLVQHRDNLVYSYFPG